MNITRSLSLRRTQRRVQLVQDEHVAIVEAIRRRDAEGASEQMRRHILNARRRMFEGTGA
jgi:DNA-binding FadR family transcriptional regulator